MEIANNLGVILDTLTEASCMIDLRNNGQKCTTELCVFELVKSGLLNSYDLEQILAGTGLSISARMGMSARSFSPFHCLISHFEQKTLHRRPTLLEHT